MQSRLMRLIGVVFLNGTMLSVPGNSESVNERTPYAYRSTKNRIPYFRGSPEVPIN